MPTIKAIIVDDEVLARELVRNYLNDIEDVEVIAECQNGFDALKVIQEQNPDLVFLDIQMPKIDGFELLDVLETKPEIIFTTAFDQYALKAFEQNAVDYLLKPFSRERLKQAVEKARARILAAPARSTSQPLESLQQHLDESDKTLNRVVARLGSKIIVIPVEKIYYLEAQDDYVMIYSELGRHLKEKTMKYFEAHLPQDGFIRIHRKYIANLAFISSVELYEKNTHLVLMKNGDKIRASQDGYKRLRGVFS
jgi:two-component system, LytTR family, response regulator